MNRWWHRTASRDFRVVVNLGVFAIGSGFLIASQTNPEAMSPQVYGDFAYDIPAEIWAAGFMAGSFLQVQALNLHPFYSAFWSAIGAALLVLLYAALIFSSITAPYGLPIWSHAAFQFIVFHAWFFLSAVRELGVQIRGGA